MSYFNGAEVCFLLAVLFDQSYGAEANRSMGVSGENLTGVFSARDFVGWYNGLPSNREVKRGLAGLQSHSSAEFLKVLHKDNL